MGKSFCNSHFSPLGPLPYLGGSRIIASYLFSLLISLLTNLRASSVRYLIGKFEKEDKFLFSKAKLIAFLLASTCVIDAPFDAAWSDAKPE